MSKIKLCVICDNPFFGRRDARTCSTRCRKALQRYREQAMAELYNKPSSGFDPAGTVPFNVRQRATAFKQQPPKNNRRFGKTMSAIVLGVFGTLALFMGMYNQPPTAHAATSSTLNFSARLLDSSGAVVPDGNYHIEFKIYDSVSSGGSAQNVCSLDSSTDDCWWKETRTTGNLVRVVNGYFNVNLGSVTAFGANIPWDQQLYLTMRIGGSGGSPSWESSEMTNSGNRIALTGVPYAFTAGKLQATSSGITNQLTFATPSGSNHTLTLPNETGTVCTNASVCSGYASATTFNLQNAYTNSTGSSTPEIILDSSRGALDIQDRSTSNGGTIGGNLLNIRGTAANDSTAGPLLFRVGNTGGIFAQNSSDSTSAFRIQNAAGTSLMTVDTSNSVIQLDKTNTGSLNAGYTNSFPTTGILDDFNRANTGPPPSSNWTLGPTNFTAGEGLQVSSNGVIRKPSGSFRQDDYWNPSTFGPDSEAYVTVTTKAGSDEVALLLRAIQIGAGTTDGYQLNVALAGGANNWAIVRITNGASTSLTNYTQAISNGDSVGFSARGNKLTAWYKPAAGSWTAVGSTEDTTYTSAGNIALQMGGGSGSVLDNFGGGTSGGAFSVNNTGQIVSRNTTDSTSAFKIQNASGTTIFQIDTTNGHVGLGGGVSGTDVVYIEKNTSDVLLGINQAGGSGDILNLRSSETNVVTVGNLGAATFQNASDSNAAFRIQSATTSDTLFTADTSLNKVVIGNSTGTNANTTLLTLDSATADPSTGYTGAMYYNTTNNKFRCYTTTWVDCDTGGGSSTLQNAYDAGSAGDQVILQDSTQDSLILRNPNGGSDSTYVLTIDQQATTGTHGGLDIQSAGVGNLLRVRDTTATATDVLTIADGGATTFRNQTDSISALKVQNAAGTTQINFDSTASTLTLSPTGPKYVGGADSTGTANSGTGSASDYLGVAVSGRYFYAVHAHNTATNCTSAAGCELQAYDNTNIGSPAYLGGANADGNTNTGTGGSTLDFNTVTAIGNYVVVGSSGSSTACNGTAGNAVGCEIQVYDVSNHKSPTIIAGRDISGSATGTSNNSVMYTKVYGKYLFVTVAGNSSTCSASDATGCELQIYDFSNPVNPIYVGGADSGGISSSTGTGTKNITFWSVDVAGKYAYATTDADFDTCSSTASNSNGCEFKVFDISDPTNPVYKGGASGGGATNSGAIFRTAFYVVVSGRYAYTAWQGDGNDCDFIPGSDLGCELKIFDISNPAAPTEVATADASGDGGDNGYTGNLDFNSLAINGSLLIVGTEGNSGAACSITVSNATTGCEVMYFDVSNPANPTFIGGADAGGGTNTGSTSAIFERMSVSGGYLYTTQSASATACSQSAGSAIGCELKVFSLGGLNTTTVTSGSTETGSLNVAMSASIQNTLDVTGMANFGQSVSIGGNLSLNGALVLASKTSAPASLAGSMYYDSSANKFKCYTTSWVNCDTTGGGGGGTVVMRYVPEFGGAVLSADGSSNSGTLTAGFVSGVGGTQGYKHNYYQWSTAQGTAQDYDIILNVQIPSDYTAIGAASTFKFWIQDPDSGTTNAQVTWTILDEDETSCFSSNFNGSTTNWEQKPASTLGSCSFAANDTMTVKFHVSTNNTAGNLKLGEFQFSYTN